MNNAPRQYAPDEQTGGTVTDHSEVRGTDVAGSQDTNDAHEDAGTLTGTDRDETGPDENMATES